MHRLLALSIVLVAAACGGGGSSDAAQLVDAHPLADAPDLPDAALGPDADLTADASAIPDAAPPPDGAVGSITIHVARATVPQAGVLVIVQADATAATAMELETDATGTLTTTITGGSYVSLINPGALDPGDSNPTFDHVLTFSDVQPGEVLDIDYGGAPTPAQPSFTVTGSPLGPPSGANVGTLCGGGLSTFGPAVTVTPTRHCEPTMPLVYIGVVGTVSGDHPVGSIYLGAAPSDGTPINVAGMSFTSPITRPFSVTHANGETAQVYAGTALLGASPHDGGHGTITDFETWNLSVAGAVPAQYQLSFIQFPDAGNGERDAFAWGSTGAFAFDAATFPAELSALVFDPATRAVHWTTGAGPTPDAVRARIVSPGGSVVWDVMGPPPVSGVLAIPHLPAAFDHALPDESGLNLRGYSATGGLPLLRGYVGHQLDRITLVAQHAAGEIRWRSIGDLSFP